MKVAPSPLVARDVLGGTLSAPVVVRAHRHRDMWRFAVTEQGVSVLVADAELALGDQIIELLRHLADDGGYWVRTADAEELWFFLWA